MTATFHLDDLGGALASALPELAVGPWRRAPGLVAFDAGADRATSLWRVGLARDDAAGQRALAGGERSVAQTHALLDDLPDRLDLAIEHGRLASPADPVATRAAEARLIAALTGVAPLDLGHLAWSASPAPGEPDPGRLGQLLDRVADLARAGPGSRPASRARSSPTASRRCRATPSCGPRRGCRSAVPACTRARSPSRCARGTRGRGS